MLEVSRDHNHLENTIEVDLLNSGLNGSYRKKEPSNSRNL